MVLDRAEQEQQGKAVMVLLGRSSKAVMVLLGRSSKAVMAKLRSCTPQRGVAV
ncbi:hypothetical protein HaLaN_19882, partial [Haematococcus lacustris]